MDGKTSPSTRPLNHFSISLLMGVKAVFFKRSMCVLLGKKRTTQCMKLESLRSTNAQEINALKRVEPTGTIPDVKKRQIICLSFENCTNELWLLDQSQVKPFIG